MIGLGRVGAAAMLWLGAAATSAQGATSACLQPQQAESLVVALIPDTLAAVAARCASALPPTATLRAGLVPIADRYRAAREAALPDAAVSAAALMGDDGEGLASSTVVDLFGQIAAREIVKEIKPRDCARVDRIVALLAPLPPGNIAGLAVEMMSAAPGRKVNGLAICPAERR